MPDRSCRTTDIPCPGCGRPLTTDGVTVWCAAYPPAGSGEALCYYGLFERVPYAPETREVPRA